MNTFTEQQIWLVWSNEHNAWWRVNACGYTTAIDGAERYTLSEARRHAGKRTPDTKGLPDELVVPAPEMEGTLAALSLRERQLREALQEYGRHTNACSYIVFAEPHPCDCGWDVARAALAQETQEGSK